MWGYVVQPGNALRIDGGPALVTVIPLSELAVLPSIPPVTPATPAAAAHAMAVEAHPGPITAPVQVSPTSPVTAQVIPA